MDLNLHSASRAGSLSGNNLAEMYSLKQCGNCGRSYESARPNFTTKRYSENSGTGPDFDSIAENGCLRWAYASGKNTPSLSANPHLSGCLQKSALANRILDWGNPFAQQKSIAKGS